MLLPKFLKVALLTGIVASFAVEATDAGPLGSSKPNLLDVSLNPNWHVYVYNDQGLTYIQVNDLIGQVRLIEATAGTDVIVLPIGSDAGRVAKPHDQASMSSNAVLVYQSSSLKLYASHPASAATLQARTMDTTALTATANGDGERDNRSQSNQAKALQMWPQAVAAVTDPQWVNRLQ
ncbi:hypothetical protein [Dyella tabacisoli]|uniref:Uncharacterized protein n=1 Tax=Dyella tabacisoli TaxID=2282381 RepID=A0A369UPY4_9GAMM|nr:hypothetical protein [Dyella tabacisoli]RDD82527.1 hypothetical protein DVJ77_06215 [Dyella tabacisoli]